MKSLSPTNNASGGSLRALCIVRLGGGGGGTTLCRHARLQLGDGFVEVVRIDQWGARYTRADHNAHCCRRSVRPHLPLRVCRSSLRSLAQVEILEMVPHGEEMNAFYRHYALQLHNEREYKHYINLTTSVVVKSINLSRCKSKNNLEISLIRLQKLHFSVWQNLGSSITRQCYTCQYIRRRILCNPRLFSVEKNVRERMTLGCISFMFSCYPPFSYLQYPSAPLTRASYHPPRAYFAGATV